MWVVRSSRPPKGGVLETGPLWTSPLQNLSGSDVRPSLRAEPQAHWGQLRGSSLLEVDRGWAGKTPRSPRGGGVQSLVETSLAEQHRCRRHHEMSTNDVDRAEEDLKQIRGYIASDGAGVIMFAHIRAMMFTYTSFVLSVILWKLVLQVARSRSQSGPDVSSCLHRYF